jgi:hypothetical protein
VQKRKEKASKRRAVLKEKWQHYSGEVILVWFYPPNVFWYDQKRYQELVPAEKAREYIEGQEYTITVVRPSG